MTSNKKIQKLVRITEIVFTLLLILICLNANSQTNDSLQPTVAIELSKMNVVYLGVDNPVKIAIEGHSYEDIEVSVPWNGDITGENGNYIIRPEKSGFLMVEVKLKDKILSKHEYHVKSIPDPIAKVNGKKGGEVPKIILLAVMGVEAYTENSFRFQVVEFVIRVAGKTANNSLRSYSYKITPEQRDLLRKLNSGDIVYFEDIKAAGPGGITRILSPLKFTIK